jgi:retron-type reverse transcriptase
VRITNLRELWDVISQKLRSGDYKPGAVRAVNIPKPNGGERALGIPRYGFSIPWT